MSDARKAWRSSIQEPRPKCEEFPGEHILVFAQVAPEKRSERELQVRAVIYCRRSRIQWAIDRRKLEDYGSGVQRDTSVDFRREFIGSTLARCIETQKNCHNKESRTAGDEDLREHVRRRRGPADEILRRLSFRMMWLRRGGFKVLAGAQLTDMSYQRAMQYRVNEIQWLYRS
jgi:hypothetical protein